MAFIDCIQERLKRGALQPAQAERLQKLFKNKRDQFAKSMGDDAAATEAAAEMVRVAAEIKAQRNRNIVRSAQAIKNNLDELKARGGGQKEAGELLKEKILRVHRRKEAVEKQLFTGLDDFIEQFRSKKAGFAIEDMTSVVREVIEPGSVADDSTKAMAKALKATYDTGRERLKSAGAIIGKIENYFPVRHNRHRLRKLIKRHNGDRTKAFDDWAASLLPKLDRNRMIDWDTGLPFTDEALLRAMREDFDDIVSNGATKFEREALEGKVRFGQAGGPARRYEANRFYIFKSADDFLKYNEDFGEGTQGLFDIFSGSIQGIARDIALLEEFGPNPQSAFDNLKGAMGRSPQSRGHVDGMFDDIMGRTNTVPEGQAWFYDGMATIWNVQRSAMLGAAPLAAINDATFLGLVARMNDMPVMGTLTNYVQLIASDPQSKQIARDIGFISDYAIGKTMTGERFAGELAPGGGAQALASISNRLSGLNAMTIAAKESIAVQQSTMLARNRNTKFSSLPEQLQNMMREHRITPDDWDKFRETTPRHNIDYDAKYMVSNDLFKRADLTDEEKVDLIGKFDEWTSRLMAEAINAPDPRTRAITTGRAFGDSMTADVLSRSVGMFKSWPIQVIFNRFIDDAKRAGGMNRIGATILFSTMLGALSVQMKDIAKGNTPREMDNPEFMVASLMQGGGFGILGDFLFHEHDRYGRSFIASAAGPTAGLFEDTLKLTVGTAQKALKGDDVSSALGDTVRLVETQTPFHTLWYGRAAIERLMFDSIERMVDPNFQEKQLQMRKRLKERGQKPFLFK